ncbi:hypothetical protein, partial [Paraburkholderia caribensis]|uniref:hypothetical protein n=1 Tax=Paraburkholderia caribensis TaxID=75105 RepID=UPI001CC35DDA
NACEPITSRGCQRKNRQTAKPAPPKETPLLLLLLIILVLLTGLEVLQLDDLSINDHFCACLDCFTEYGIAIYDQADGRVALISNSDFHDRPPSGTWKYEQETVQAAQKRRKEKKRRNARC